MLAKRAIVAVVALSLSGLPAAHVQAAKAAKPEPDRCTRGGATKGECPTKRDGNGPQGCPIILPPLSLLPQDGDRQLLGTAPIARLFTSFAAVPATDPKGPCGLTPPDPPTPVESPPVTPPPAPQVDPAKAAPGYIS